MDKLLNEGLFEVLLEKSFFKHEKELQKTYPDDEELEKEYPTSRRKVRRYINILKEKKYGKKLIWMYASRAAVAFLCVISLLFGFVMINSEVRASVEKVFFIWYDKYTEVVFNETSDDFSSYELEDFEIGYIPEGFELQYETNLDDMRLSGFINTKKEDSLIDIQIFDGTQASIGIDNEQMLYEKIKIGSNDAWIMYNDEAEYGCLLVVYGKISILVVGDLSKEEIIKVAENIK